MRPCATDHWDAQYAVATRPLYQIQPLWRVPKAIQATTPNCARTSAPRSGAGRALLNQSVALSIALRTRMLARVIAIPDDRLLQPLAQRRAGAEAEQLLRA